MIKGGVFVMLIKKLKSQKGMTLIEIIVALAVLGIVIISILSLFRLASSQIFTSGTRTDTILDARSIADDLIEQSENQNFTTSIQIDSYLIGKGYHGVYFLDDIAVKFEYADVNYYIGAESVKAGVTGYEVTFYVFFDDKNSVSITTFIIKGGGI